MNDSRISNSPAPLLNRRSMLGRCGMGLGALGLAGLLHDEGLLGAANPLSSKTPHFLGKAKSVIWIFVNGGPSQVDTWDYKPQLIKRHGQPMPGGDKLITFQGEQGNLMKSPWEFKPRGQSGKMVTDLLPRLGDLADEMCFLHGMTGKTNTHGPGENFMCTGFTLDGFPSAGAWTTYALGSEAEDLPAYVAIPDVRGTPQPDDGL